MGMGELKAALAPGAEADVAADATRRAQNCMIDIRNALGKWRCQIDPMIMLSQSEGIKTTFRVIPLVERPVG